MDRRQLFRRAAQKTGAALLDHVDGRAAARAAHWIRPPFALDEFDFLLACTRCVDCIEACPEGIIFPLAARLGADVAGTPALDLLNHGCVMCEDWPCVAACEPGALVRPGGCGTDGPSARPSMAVLTIDPAGCLPYSGPECGACAICPVPGALIWDQNKPTINPDNCTGCALCRDACIVEPKAIRIESIYQTQTRQPL